MTDKNAEIKVTDQMYETVTNDMMALSKSIKDPKKAEHAKAVSEKFKTFNETNPAPVKDQIKIVEFLDKKENLLSKDADKKQEAELEI